MKLEYLVLTCSRTDYLGGELGQSGYLRSVALMCSHYESYRSAVLPSKLDDAHGFELAMLAQRRVGRTGR